MQIIIANAQRKIRLNQKRIEGLTTKILKILRLPSKSSLSITFVSKRKIQQLNKIYFRSKSATDVIAFGYRETEKRTKRSSLTPGYSGSLLRYEVYQDYLGDIIICPSVALENSRIYNNNFFSELTLYVIHGILHLLGYSDTTRSQSLKMQKKEAEVLRRL